MDTSSRTLVHLGLATLVAGGVAASPVQAQWTVSMRAMQNPLPLGQCTGIEVTIVDGRGYPPVRPDNKQVSGWDFDLDFTAASPDAFAWRDERHRFLCAKAPTAASAMVIARYPAQSLKPTEVVSGLALQQSIELQMQGMPASPAQPAPGYGPGPVAGTSGTPPVDPATGYAAGAPAYPAGTGPTNPQPQTYGTGSTPPVPSPVAQGSQAVVATPAASVTAEVQPGVKSLGGLFKKIGAHAKAKAGEVTNQTAQNIATGAEDVVDTSLETGAGVASGAALEVTNSARSTIGGVGRSLTPVALRGGESSDNLATVMAAGGAELRMLRFTAATDVLEPASRDLIKRLAAALNATQGNFVIEGHVDPLPSPTASQELSEHRAAAVKLALIRNGVVATRLKALGYGASEPKPELPPGGGPPSSARIVVARDTPPTP